MASVVRHSRFVSNPFGDGAAKRSAQIEELLQQAGVVYVNDEFALPKGMGFMTKLLWLLAGLRFVVAHFSWKEIRSIRNCLAMSKYFGLRMPLFETYKEKDVVFLNEDTTSSAYGFPYLAKEIGKKMLSLPHNMESLCCLGRDLQSGKPRLGWLSEDIIRLKLCDAVFCISKEEMWLLSIHGVNAHYLPYYPPKVAEDYLLGVRKKRQGRNPNEICKFLILGSASNEPTRQGMDEVLSYFSSYGYLPFEIHVAGYRTECLEKKVHPQIVYHGTLSNDELEEMMIEVDALVINQPATSGALTRIVEHLVAGIPVIASFGAARDYYQSDDVQVFYSMDELMDLLKSFQCGEAVMPHRNNKAEQRFVEWVRNSSKEKL